jgi:hypothetical protein
MKLKLEMTNFQAVAANLPVGGEVCDLPPLQPSAQPEVDTEVAPRIQKITATSIAEIDRLMDELKLAKESCNPRESELNKRQFVMRTLLRWRRSRPRSSLTRFPNGTPLAANNNQLLLKRPRTRVIITVSGIPPNSVGLMTSPVHSRGSEGPIRAHGISGAPTQT